MQTPLPYRIRPRRTPIHPSSMLRSIPVLGRSHIAFVACLALLLVDARSASAAQPTGESHRAGSGIGWGPRVGVTVNPDQIHFGAHLDAGNFSPRVRFQPNVEVGIGDHLTLIALNFEAAYRFRHNWDVWTPYAGGGIGIDFRNFNSGYGPGDGSQTDFAVNALGGIEKGLKNGDRFFLELKLGLADAPDFKVTVGWTFL